ncbi:TetR/AcrR family transcriptional regulator [Glycomyces xiaoerkulensis]|uniref:TetR/AcrR family transcriptional regulator n=1 Tax=Glycomyces xiaoerkulensis TaxID=2038139 RepID=UPI000C269AF1|nr:TetR-like C-terminal domain-containing protein [Glycomyces xiaoerkulensis]
MSSTYHHGDLRRALIDAAVEAIAETGPSALSLRAAAKRAGVSHSAPAHHFGDKAGLLTAVAVQGYERFADTLERSWRRTGDFIEVGAAYLRFAIDHRAYFETMFRPELLHEEDPDLVRGRERARRILYLGSAPAEEGVLYDRRALAAWSLVHGLSSLLVSGNFPPELAADPEAAFRAVAAGLGELRG